MGARLAPRTIIAERFREAAMPRFAGIYRAQVIDNSDPEKRQRLKVRIPEVLPGTEMWALPCVEAGSKVLPSVGSIVWVMFEHGDPSYPVWLGVLPPSVR
jgi:hypothetical protein